MRRFPLFGPLLVWALVFVVWGPLAVRAQTVIRGVVTNAETEAPIPQATLQVDGTYTGTVTNDEGRYALRVDSLPVTVVVQHIGYETARFRLTDATDRRQSVALQPSSVEMDGVVVTGSRNPGRDIMRRVIEQKKTWWDALETYEVDAYSRYTFANDTSIVAIHEVQTRTFWDRARGTREIVRARQGAGMLDSLSTPAAATVVNLYRDNVEVAGAELMGVTHPEALKRYAFTLDSTRSLDGRRVYDLRVEPKNRLASAFVGRVSVLDSTYAMIAAELRPAQSLRLPRMVKGRSVLYEQQFSNFGGSFWLPVDFRSEISFELEFSALLTFPRIHLTHVARLSDYEVNGPLPDSLFDSNSSTLLNRGTVASSFSAPDSQKGAGPYVPLSDREREVYARPDSTHPRFTQAFRPGGLLGTLLDLQSDSDLSLGLMADEEEETPAASDSTAQGKSSPLAIDLERVLPTLWYNRVEGGHLGAKVRVGLGSAVTFRGRGGHSVHVNGPARWSYGAGASVDVHTPWMDKLTLDYRYGIDPRYASDIRLFPPLTRGLNSLWTLAGAPDFYDYFGAERLRVGVKGAVPAWDVEGRIQFRSERHFSVTGVTNYNLLGRGTQQPPNPPITEGVLRSVAGQLRWGDDPPLLGLVPVDRVVANVEHSSATLGSDFGFTYGQIAVDAHVETFFRRRVLPMALELRLEGGGALGTLPLQRFGIVEASPLPYTPFGSLRSLDDRPYQGTDHAALFWEHNFRTVPFEWLGLYGLADRHIELLLHGGHARTWIPDGRATSLRQRGMVLRTTDGVHHELGFSVNGLLRDLLRIDVTARLDAPGMSVGVSLLRVL